MTAAAVFDRSPPKLTLWRLTKAQFRAFIGGSLVGWGVVAVLLLAVASGVVAGLAGLSEHRFVGVTSIVNTAISFAGVAVQLFAIVVGSEAVAGEFAIGTIGATLSSSPRRGTLFAAKTLAICGSVILLAGLAGFLAGGSALLIALVEARPIDAITSSAWLASTGGLAFGAGILALLSLGLGAWSRQRMIAVLVPVAAIYILPLLVAVLPVGTGRDWLNSVLPGTALSALATAHVQDGVVVLGTSLPGTASETLLGALFVLGVWSVFVVPWAILAFIRHDLSASSRSLGRVAPRDPAEIPHVARPVRSSLRGLLRSEFRKSWSLPVIRWIFALSVVLEIGYGLARASWNSLDGVGGSVSESLSIEYSYAITGGVGGVALILAVLVAIQVAGEFETGTAVSTFIAAHRRRQVTVSKLFMAALSAAAFGIPALVVTAVVTAPIYAARGYPLDADSLVAGSFALARALLFLLFTTAMSAGIAGTLRRTVPTVMTVSILLIIGPALLNTILGFARMAQSPLVVIGNAARLLPWEGSNFFVLYSDDVPFASLDGSGVLQVSALFGILVTALWAALAVASWFATDARRSISTR